MSRIARPLALFFALLAMTPAVSAQQLKEYNVFLRSNIGKATMWDGVVVTTFGMATKLSGDPTLPAATLYCNEGDTLVLNALSISQKDHHTIHLHGLDADTKNDGDPATSFELSHMQTFPYTVVADHAGTYIYHCHEMDVIHVQMGMYGLIVVRPKDGGQTAWTGGPHYDRTVSWLTSELDRSWHENIPPHDTVADTIHVPPYRPGYFLINGKSESQIDGENTIPISASSGDEVYVRLANIGFFYNRVIFPPSVKARKIDSDGRPLLSPIENDTVEVAPGERYGMMLTMPDQLNDVVRIEYVNMNTDSIWNTQRVPISTSALKVASPDQSVVNPYPNPASAILYFGSDKSQVIAVDVLGRSFSVPNHGGTLDISTLPAGAYYIGGQHGVRFVKE
jgi:FtsP/CotA-like multicopper oxidase with cupredoxin domain